MHTILIVMTPFIDVPFFVFRTFNCVLGKVRKALKAVGSFVFSKAREPKSFYQHTRLLEKNRFRKFVSETTDLWIDTHTALY
jgi:hypothetical protein